MPWLFTLLYNAVMSRTLLAAVAFAALMSLPGCVRRTITINSSPDGALVWLNDREVGRTPVTVDFVHYGTYDVVLVKDGYEPLVTIGNAKTPLWDTPPLDLGAELLPARLRSRIVWDYDLTPSEADSAAVIERGRALRERTTSPEPTQADS